MENNIIMALRKSNSSTGGNYLEIKHGGIIISASRDINAAAKEGKLTDEQKEALVEQGYEEHQVFNPSENRQQMKWFKKFGTVDGLIKAITWYDTEDQQEQRYMGLKITIVDDEDTYVMDLPYAKSHYDSFVKFSENIDFSQPVEFSAWPDTNSKGKDVTAFTARQNGEIIRQRHTKAEIEGGVSSCPAATTNKVGKLNFDDQRDWLLDNLNNNVIPKVVALYGEPDEVHGKSGVVEEEPAVKTKGKAKAKAALTDQWPDTKSAFHDDE